MEEKKQPKYAAVAKRLANARQFLNISQSEFARRAGITPVEASQYFTGKRLPSEEMTEKFAKVLHVQPIELVTHSDRAIYGKHKKERPTRVKRRVGRPAKLTLDTGPHKSALEEEWVPSVRPPKAPVVTKPQPTLIKEPPKVHLQVESVKPRFVAKLHAASSVSTCRGVYLEGKRVLTCMLPLKDNGVEGAGFCEDCWYPGIGDRYDTYRAFVKDGFSNYEAAIRAGLGDLF